MVYQSNILINQIDLMNIGGITSGIGNTKSQILFIHILFNDAQCALVILVVKFPFLSVMIVSVKTTVMEHRGYIFSASHSDLIATLAAVFVREL
jgi:hypothetical protein